MRHATVKTMTLVIVMAGLVPAIHVFDLAADQGVDARHEPALGLDPRGPGMTTESQRMLWHCLGNRLSCSKGNHVPDLQLQRPSRTTSNIVDSSDPVRQARVQLEEAERLRCLGQHDRARAICEPLVARYGDYFGALHTLGLIYYDKRDYPVALGLLVRAAMLNPYSWRTLTVLSDVYLRLGAREMAAQTLEQARRIKPKDPDVLVTLGAIYEAESEYELGRDAFREALALDPSLEAAAMGLGACSAHLGEHAEAARAFEGLYKRGARSVDLLYSLSLLPAALVKVDVLSAVGKLVKRQGEEAEFETSVALIRAACLHNSGRHAEAWEQLVSANRAIFRRVQQKLPGLTARNRRTIESLRKTTIKPANRGGAHPVSLLIFGPSRSGKSSIESLLGIVDGVKLGYENPILANATRGALQTAGFLNTGLLEQLPPQFYPLCREIYLDELARRAGSAKVFTNTHPAHIQNVGSIAAIVPNVRFILVKRNPDDNALRIFMRKYNQGNSYAYDLNTIREHLTWYHEMIDVLAEKLPSIVRVIHYEDMIADPAAALRTTLELCGLAMPATPLPDIGDDRGCALPYRQFMTAVE
jgi:tetratricopeptide (TPR) repeat protein